MSAMEEQKLAVDIIKKCPRKNTRYDAGGRCVAEWVNARKCLS